MALVAALRDECRRDPLAAITAGFLVAVCALALIGPWLSAHDPLATDAANALKPPSWRFPCGTDQVGRDICTRIVYATRLDLFIATTAVVLAIVVGSVLGSVAGFFGGWTDRMAMWVVDTIMAFPLFVLARGIMVAEGASFIITGEWWVALFPGLALVLVVLSLNLLGDGLRDMIDARERR